MKHLPFVAVRNIKVHTIFLSFIRKRNSLKNFPGSSLYKKAHTLEMQIASNPLTYHSSRQEQKAEVFTKRKMLLESCWNLGGATSRRRHRRRRHHHIRINPEHARVINFVYSTRCYENTLEMSATNVR